MGNVMDNGEQAFATLLLCVCVTIYKYFLEALRWSNIWYFSMILSIQYNCFFDFIFVDSKTNIFKPTL